MTSREQQSNTRTSSHQYGAESSLVSAQLRVPVSMEVKPQAQVVLPVQGGYSYKIEGPFQRSALLSFKSGSTQVAGHLSSSPGCGFVTFATSVIEGLNFFDVVTADRIVGQVFALQSTEDSAVPAVSFLGTRFENLRINGNPIYLDLDSNILGPKPASGRSYSENPEVLERISNQSRAFGISRNLPDWAVDELPAVQRQNSTTTIRCSLVRNVEGAPGTSFAHVIEVPNFGRIFLGELTVEEQAQRFYTFSLSMIRMQLDSAVEGTVRVIDAVCNVGRNSEDKAQLQRDRGIEVRSDAEVAEAAMGMVTQRLSEINLAAAMPSQEPPRDLIQGEFIAWAHDSGRTPELRRANVWSAALETRIRNSGDNGKPSGTVLTTYGFIRTPEGVRLGVIHYLDPAVAFQSDKAGSIQMMGWRFPVMIRPWLPTQHGGVSQQDGNCWVKFADDKGRSQHGILTARHVLMPGGTEDIGLVRLKVSRSTPALGRIHRLSDKMDAALIAIDREQWGGKVATRHSTVVGYKPIRIITGHGSVDADVVEHQGFAFATIPGEPGKEPLNAVHMFLNKTGEPGDSGCLIVDMEFADVAEPRPYLLYLGAFGARGGQMGFGLLIEQVNRIWGVDCFMNADSKREKKHGN